MILFVRIFVNKLFTFSVSDLTVRIFVNIVHFLGFRLDCFSGYLSISRSLSQFQTWLFPSLDSWEKAMWFSFRHDFSNSIYISVFAVYESLSCCVWFGVSGFSIFCASVIVLGICWCVCLYISWWISSFSRSENQIFFVIVLTFSARLVPESVDLRQQIC